jgi:hypothetical protein
MLIRSEVADVALRRGIPLASLDSQLRAAMKKAGGSLVL